MKLYSQFILINKIIFFIIVFYLFKIYDKHEYFIFHVLLERKVLTPQKFRQRFFFLEEKHNYIESNTEKS